MTTTEQLFDDAIRQIEIAQSGEMISSGCVFCDLAHEPVKLRRRWVHHIRGSGRLILCNLRNVKSGA